MQVVAACLERRESPGLLTNRQELNRMRAASTELSLSAALMSRATRVHPRVSVRWPRRSVRRRRVASALLDGSRLLERNSSELNTLVRGS